MSKSFTTLAVAVAAAGFATVAWAQDARPAPGTPGTTTTTTTVTTDTVETRLVPAPTITRAEARQLKSASQVDYTARKKVAEANHDQAAGDCRATTDAAVERACQADARAAEAREMADARRIHEREVLDIDARTR